MPALGFSVKKSLQELEGSYWGRPDRGDTGLVKRCHQLRKIPLESFTASDLRVMIGQQIGLAFLLPLALQHLEEDPLLDSSLYPCDLLVNVLTVDSDFWQNHPQLREKVADVAKHAISLLPSRPDIATKTVTRTVTRAYGEFENQSKAG